HPLVRREFSRADEQTRRELAICNLQFRRLVRHCQKDKRIRPNARMSIWGAQGCQPVLFGSLPKSFWSVRSRGILARRGSRRQAADDNRLAALCSPENGRV